MEEITTVLWFSKFRGYGFLTDPQGGQDLFVHWTQILTGELGNRNLETGQTVTFERKIIKGRPVATGVRIIEEGAQ
jgi:cold shock protein